MPTDLPVGAHTMQAEGVGSDVRARALSSGVEVAGAVAVPPDAAAPVGELAFTGRRSAGTALLGAGLLGAGLMMTLGARRRRLQVGSSSSTLT